MHASSYENMRYCRDRYISTDLHRRSAPLKILDIGGADVNGSYRELFPEPEFHYRSADIDANSAVDIPMHDPHRIPVPDKSMDIVVSGQALEHAEFFWLLFAEMVRITADDGLIFLIAPSAGQIHRFPVDCYRFYPDGFRALAKYTDTLVVDIWLDERGPWCDLVGVFCKSSTIKEKLQNLTWNSRSDVLEFTAPPAVPGSTEEEVTKGAVPYLDVLQCIHQNFQPKRYLEIGVRRGSSFRLAQCDATGVDPLPEIIGDLPEQSRIVQLTSDQFFRESKGSLDRFDLAFIDGLHWFEQALMDFMHVEQCSRTTSAIIIDDIFPNHPSQAFRHRSTQVWTGDVWKLYHCLTQYRPDLLTIALDTSPTGLLLVAGLNPESRVLWQKYNPIVRQFTSEEFDAPPSDIIERKSAICPRENVLKTLLSELREMRALSSELSSREVRTRLNKLL